MTTDREPSTGDPRLSFDRVVDVYDRIHPAYPDDLIDDVCFYGRFGDERPLSAVEVGPGTGQATKGLLRRGFAVVAIEIGSGMAERLRTRFRGEKLDVIVGAFEAQVLEEAVFDLVLSAAAFHWLEPTTRLHNIARLLRDDGVVAIVDIKQIQHPADRGFFDRVDSIYKTYRPTDQKKVLPGADVVPSHDSEIALSEWFVDTSLIRRRWDRSYSSAEYRDLVLSYAVTQQMPPGAREEMIRELCAVIDAEFDGFVVRPLVLTISLARRVKR